MRKGLKNLVYCIIGAIPPLLASGCIPLVAEHTGNADMTHPYSVGSETELVGILSGDWVGEEQTFHFDGTGEFDYVENDQGRKIFDSGREVVLNKSPYGILGFRDSSETEFLNNGVRVDLTREHQEHDVFPKPSTATLEGVLLSPSTMDITFYFPYENFIPPFQNGETYKFIKSSSED